MNMINFGISALVGAIMVFTAVSFVNSVFAQLEPNLSATSVIMVGIIDVIIIIIYVIGLFVAGGLYKMPKGR